MKLFKRLNADKHWARLQVSLLKEGVDSISKDDVKSSIRFIENASKNAFQLLQNLLAWAMTQTRQVRLYKKTLSIHMLVNKEIEIQENIAATKNIIIKNVTDEETKLLQMKKQLVQLSAT